MLYLFTYIAGVMTGAVLAGLIAASGQHNKYMEGYRDGKRDGMAH